MRGSGDIRAMGLVSPNETSHNPVTYSSFQARCIGDRQAVVLESPIGRDFTFNPVTMGVDVCHVGVVGSLVLAVKLVIQALASSPPIPQTATSMLSHTLVFRLEAVV